MVYFTTTLLDSAYKRLQTNSQVYNIHKHQQTDNTMPKKVQEWRIQECAEWYFCLLQGKYIYLNKIFLRHSLKRKGNKIQVGLETLLWRDRVQMPKHQEYKDKCQTHNEKVIETKYMV